MNNKNYRVMKFFEPVNKKDKSRGYVRLDIRGIKGNIIVSVENIGDVKTTSEVYLYKDRANKIKLGDINNKKGMIKKLLTFGSNNAIEDYNTCAIVKDKKIVMYTNLFNASSVDQVRKLEADYEETRKDEVARLEETAKKALEPKKEQVEAVAPEKAPMEAVDTEKTPVEAAEPEKKPMEDAEPRQETFEAFKEVKNIVEKEEVEEGKTEIPVSEDTMIKKTSVSSAVDIHEDSTKHEEKEENARVQSHTYRNRFDEGLFNVLRDYKRVEPLSVKIKDFDWWLIPYDETGVRNGFLPYYNQIISSYYPYPMSNRVTTCAGLMKKYGHYIFGVYKEKGEIVKFIYGVPGEFTKEEQPYKGVTGFKNWSYSSKEKNDKHGYWLAFVNPKTGETTEPPQIVLS